MATAGFFAPLKWPPPEFEEAAYNWIDRNETKVLQGWAYDAGVDRAEAMKVSREKLA